MYLPSYKMLPWIPFHARDSVLCFRDPFFQGPLLRQIMDSGFLSLGCEPLLGGRALCRMTSVNSLVSRDFQARRSNRKIFTSRAKPNSRPARKPLHNHKTPDAYADLPIFENPCPLCFFDHCRKVLRSWIVDRRNLTQLSRSR